MRYGGPQLSLQNKKSQLHKLSPSQDNIIWQQNKINLQQWISGVLLWVNFALQWINNILLFSFILKVLLSKSVCK